MASFPEVVAEEKKNRIEEHEIEASENEVEDERANFLSQSQNKTLCSQSNLSVKAETSADDSGMRFGRSVGLETSRGK